MSKRFPIMKGPSLPWAMIDPYEGQAQTNHGQSLARLAQRGGLSPMEAICVLDCKPFPRPWRGEEILSKTEALSVLKEKLAEYERESRTTSDDTRIANAARKIVSEFGYCKDCFALQENGDEYASCDDCLCCADPDCAFEFFEDAYDAPGWYWRSIDYPDGMHIGPFDTRDEAVDCARETGKI